ncbi:MAG: acyl-CoA dehydrogenase family protein [Pseudomonadota bacterium]
MDFSISEDQQSAQQLAQQILTDKTDATRLAEIEQHPARFDRELWQALADAGLLGLSIDEQYGGMGLGYFALTLLCEEVGRTVAPIPVLPVLATAATTIQQFGPDAMKEAWLPGIASGDVLIGAALEEYGNDDATDPAAIATAIGGGYQLSGTKIAVSLADSCSRVLLSARANGELLAVLVDPQAEGVSLQPQVVTSGETRFELRLENVLIAESDVLAAGGAAARALTWAMQATRVALCATAVGLTDKMMRMTGSYTSEREQFGRAVATFQAVSHRVADCFIDVECLRLVTQQAASLLDAGGDATNAVQVAKVWCGDVTHRVSQASQHCHGGAGVDRDYPLHRYCLWARQLELAAGSGASQLGALGESIAQSWLSKASA